MKTDNLPEERKLRLSELEEEDRNRHIEAISKLLTTIQRMGQVLANETHSDIFTPVNELNQLLHQAHLKLEEIKNSVANCK